MSEPELDVDKETITTYELLERSAESALKLQREDGSFPPGRNYTYDEPETPVRTTSHWTVTLSEVYDITGKEKFREAADAAVDYLLNDEVRPHGYTYYCRDAPGKDHCNGLVGQAGPIRALAHAGPILERQDAIDTAEEVFMMHPFDEELGLWERVEIDGKKLSFDRTLNHQILFAAAGSQLVTECLPVQKEIQIFLNELNNNIGLSSDGLIRHYARPDPLEVTRIVLQTPRHYHLLINELAYQYNVYTSSNQEKERGYQMVNLSGLSQIKYRMSDHEFWNSTIIKRSIKFLRENQEELVTGKKTKHGSMMPRIDVANTINIFDNITNDELADLVGSEIRDKLNRDTYLLNSDEISENDLAPLVSKIVYLPDIQIELK